MMDEEESKVSSEDDNVSSDEDSSSSETELMVTTRARRTTAGNRYSTLVAQEEVVEEDDEDEVAMLFAEGEGEDEDFNSDEGDEEADMSSSDDDDQGPNAAADDVEGEKELEKEAKAARTKKRKADLALTTVAGLKKRPRIDPTALRRMPVPKPSKRKERVSWLPESKATPGRISLRKQTILHRAETHAKLRENEEQRLKLKARREKREREREAAAPKEMTQADRLAEAERVERRNAKSLNRWEAMEKKRAEEQAAKLAALKERTLEGAVVTWYSSSAKYVGLKDSRDIDDPIKPEGKKRGRKPKALLEQLAAAKLAASQESSVTQTQGQPTEPQHPSDAPASPGSITSAAASQTPLVQAESQVSEGSPAEATNLSSMTAMDNNSTPLKEELDTRDNAFLTGIHEFASMQSERKPNEKVGPQGERLTEETEHKDLQAEQPQTKSQADMNIDSESVGQESPAISSEQKTEAVQDIQVPKAQSQEIVYDAAPDNNTSEDPQITVDGPISTTTESTSRQENGAEGPSETVQISQTSNGPDVLPAEDGTNRPAETSPSAGSDQPLSAVPPTEPLIEVISTKNVVILEKFDELKDQARHDYGFFYNSRRSLKPVKHNQELCPVTGLTARYRDPATGIGYSNALAYRKLQDLRKQEYVWSSMLGCYVGRVKTVARGVPEGFSGT